MSSIGDRIAGAPISWGVCEVPGWGYQLSPERVLGEMRDVGIRATEFGPDGFLPEDPAQKAKVLASYNLRAVGGFVPAVVHDPAQDPRPIIDRALDGFVAAGARVLVLAATTGLEGYDARPELDAKAWATLFGNLDALAERADARGVRLVLHPHVGTVIEREEEVHRMLAGSQVPLCVDTGHLLIGGTDPLALVREAPRRVGHMHLKDVNGAWAERVRKGEVTYTEAVRAGIYRPLGQGDVGVAAVVQALESAGYDGWYVMEQDAILTDAPKDEGPLKDVRASVSFLRGLAA